MGDLAERLEAIIAANNRSEWLEEENYIGALREAAALARRVEGAEVVDGARCASVADLAGQLIALVPVAGGGGRG
jgi:hypothetical protein